MVQIEFPLRVWALAPLCQVALAEIVEVIEVGEALPAESAPPGSSRHAESERALPLFVSLEAPPVSQVQVVE